MYSPRYGNLAKIAAKTGDRCHLCHEPVDLAFYGPTGLFGADTVNVDHLVPQAFGGDDDFDNLLLAHGDCNSRRGIRSVKATRLALAGTTRAPASEGEQLVEAVAVGSLAAIAAGHMLAEQQPNGTRRFNSEAALGVGLLAGLLFLAAA
jgi:hypothetical protein